MTHPVIKARRELRPIKPSIPGWATTFDLTEAMFGCYIGEAFIEMKPLDNSIRCAFTGEWFKPLLMFYYGTRDEELSKMFGYQWPSAERLE